MLKQFFFRKLERGGQDPITPTSSRYATGLTRNMSACWDDRVTRDVFCSWFYNVYPPPPDLKYTGSYKLILSAYTMYVVTVINPYPAK